MEKFWKFAAFFALLPIAILSYSVVSLRSELAQEKAQRQQARNDLMEAIEKSSYRSTWARTADRRWYVQIRAEPASKSCLNLLPSAPVLGR